MPALHVFLKRRHDRFFAAQALRLNFLERQQHALVILRHDFDEFRQVIFPVAENLRGALALGVSLMALAPPAVENEVARTCPAPPTMEVAADAKKDAVITSPTAHTRNPCAVSRKYTSSV